MLITSFSECMSLAMLEALSFGIPVISTPVSGAREVLEDNDCGIVVNTFSPNILANTVIELIKNEAMVNRLRMNALKVIKNKYNEENMVANHFKMYKSIITKKTEKECVE